jgi:hypothetical protein
MCGGPDERPDDPTRDRVERLLEQAFADDPKFLDAFLRVERAERAKIVADASTVDDAEASRQMKGAAGAQSAASDLPGIPEDEAARAVRRE